MLLIDEVHIKENLVFDKHGGQIIGFANLGDLNEHLTQFELSLTSEQPKKHSTACQDYGGLYRARPI